MLHLAWFRKIGFHRIRLILAIFFVPGMVSNVLVAQVFDERFEDWPLDLKIPGMLAVADETQLSLDHLRELLGKTSNDTLLLVSNGAMEPSRREKLDGAFANVFSSNESDWENAPLVDVIVWVAEGFNSEDAKDRLGSIEPRLRKQLQSGKTVMVLGQDRKVVSRQFMLNRSDHPPVVARGMNLLPDSVLETDLETFDAGRSQMLGVLATEPRCVGISLEKRTSLVLDGRRIRIVGDGAAEFLLAANENHSARSQIVAPQVSARQSPAEWMIDLTQWRRDAIDRMSPLFPPIHPQKPFIEHGMLMIVGGSSLPNGLMEDFVESAGGKQNAKLVYIPCSENDSVPSDSGMISTWREMGVQHTSLLHTKDRMVANQDEDFLQPLCEATGIWFGGGRQWNFSDSYYGTKAHRLMKEVLHRGGIIGGSSAGASIQARYLARATPIENFRIMAPGYERGGLGFIDGVAIDQHFTQRRRQSDMTTLVDRYPQLLGIGIDESTAITVKKSTATVRGKGHVYFYDRRTKSNHDRPDYVRLQEGQAFDLDQRQVIGDP